MFSQSYIRVNPYDDLNTLKEKAVSVTPTKRQLDWQRLELTAFIHFGINTFTDREWGDGKDDPNLFYPINFNPEQWVDILSRSGFKGLILTCKHHEGFCLWPSKYTDYSVRSSRWRGGDGDVVKEVSNACKKFGMKFGVYLSPWDRHDTRYGNSPVYNEYFMNQLTELLTQYGDIYEVWLDGACDEGKNGKLQEYDWNSYYSLIRKLQPKAVISVEGPDVRWVGNEEGNGRENEWSVIPSGKLLPCIDRNTQDSFIVTDEDMRLPDLGSDSAIESAKEKYEYMFWYPAQVDTSIRPGWFYHDREDMKVKTLDELIQVYYNSVGSNSQLLLNIPPNKTGLISKPDISRLEELSSYLRQTFDINLAEESRISTSYSGNIYICEIELSDINTFNHIVIMENIMKGQRISDFIVEIEQEGDFKTISKGKTIGYKKILTFKDVVSQKIRIIIGGFRAKPEIEFIGVYRSSVYTV